MQIHPNIEMLEIPVNRMGSISSIYPTLFHDDQTAILVDTGFPGQLSLFQAAIEQAGVNFDRVHQIILTHHDIDHIGGLRQFQTALQGQVKTLAYVEEKAYIQGEKSPLKLAQFENNLDTLTEDQKTTYTSLKTGFANAFGPVDQILTDGEVLPDFGGITIIATPGHTLGHICLYHIPSKTLIAGDALRVENGQIQATPARINYDMSMYQASLKKLADLDIESVISYHGGLSQDRPKQNIADLASGSLG